MKKKFGIRKTLNVGSKTCAGSYKWFRKFDKDKNLREWVTDPAYAKTWSSKEDAQHFLAAVHLGGRIVEIR